MNLDKYSSPNLQISDTGQVSQTTRIASQIKDIQITLSTSPEERELRRLESTPVRITDKDKIKFGVEPINNNSETDQKSYLVFGIITAMNDDSIVLDTGERQFTLFKQIDSRCFAEIPTPGTKVDGTYVECSKNGIPQGSYAIIQVAVKSGETQAKYSLLRFIIPKLYKEMMLGEQSE